VIVLGACAHEFAVERRETPVHVWLSAPDLSRRGGTIQALVYVGGYKAVDGAVEFAEGVSTVTFPTLYMNSGAKRVHVVLDRGAVVTSQDVAVDRETWVHVTLSHGAATVRSYDEQPRVPP
jgi:hypothetical protein